MKGNGLFRAAACTACAAFTLLAIACDPPARRDFPAASKDNAGPASPAQENTMNTGVSKTAHPDVVKRFCGQPPGPAPVAIKMLKDSAGYIGGYYHTERVMDAPVYYLDRQGKDLAVFHVFASDAEKAKNQPLIDALRKAYPIEDALNCP